MELLINDSELLLFIHENDNNGIKNCGEIEYII